MKIVAIIQARTGSTRLPGKVLLPLGGSSVLGQVVARVRAATGLDDVWIATTTHAGDDAVVAEAGRLGVACFRGSMDDVLDRYHGAARAAAADGVVRITSDCPLFDGPLLDRMLARFRAESQSGPTIDYMSNVIERTFPRGLDAEIFTRAALERAWRESTRTHDREHVTPYLYGHPDHFVLRSFRGERDLSGYRWTLDTPADWEFIQAVYAELGSTGRLFTTEEVVNLLVRRPELVALNAHVEQKTT